ncbi:MAG: MoaD/ThiS family protein [Chloroflexota bacterium]|nr:MAG: MoaD/ThiS family protein [Chloroflexota bacterium]
MKLYGVLRRRRPDSAEGAPHHPFDMTVPAGATAGDLLDALGINHALVNGLAVNGQVAAESTRLQDGDDIRLFPPSAGGQKPHVFIAGIMQGSRSDHLIDAQDYRQRITDALETYYPGVRVSDPFALHPESVSYEMDRVRETLEALATLAGQADVVIAYLPTASMGTAIEMWTAYNANKYIIAVTELKHNWVVKVTADQVVPDLDSLLDLLESGQLAGILNP